MRLRALLSLVISFGLCVIGSNFFRFGVWGWGSDLYQCLYRGAEVKRQFLVHLSVRLDRVSRFGFRGFGFVF